MEIAVLAIIGLLGLTGAVIAGNCKLDGYEQGYSDGFDDCLKIRRDCDLTADEERVKKIVTQAVKQYIKDEGYYRRGDIKKLDGTADFGELKTEVHNICVRRGE